MNNKKSRRAQLALSPHGGRGGGQRTTGNEKSFKVTTLTKNSNCNTYQDLDQVDYDTALRADFKPTEWHHSITDCKHNEEEERDSLTVNEWELHQQETDQFDLFRSNQKSLICAHTCSVVTLFFVLIGAFLCFHHQLRINKHETIITDHDTKPVQLWPLMEFWGICM